MAMTEAQKKADKTYREKNKPLTFAVAYKVTDINEGLRLKTYLNNTNQSANSYIKLLIKNDLDKKNIPYT